MNDVVGDVVNELEIVVVRVLDGVVLAELLWLDDFVVD